MLEMLSGRALRMRIEPPRENGAEFWLERPDSPKEHWQVKRQISKQKTWTLKALSQEGVLTHFLNCLKAGDACTFASLTDATELRTLAERAVDADTLAEFKTAFVADKTWAPVFTELLSYWPDVTEEDAFRYLKSVRVKIIDDRTLTESLVYALELRFDNSPDATLGILRAHYVDSVHRFLTADSVCEHLLKLEIDDRLASPQNDEQSKTGNGIFNLARDGNESARRLEKKLDELPGQIAQDVAAAVSAKLLPTGTHHIHIPSDGLQSHFEKAFYHARNELISGSAATARNLFTTLAESIEHEGIEKNRKLYFRVKSNLGLSFVYLGKPEQAAKHFAESFGYSEGSVKGRINRALALRLRGEPEKALRIIEGIIAEDDQDFEAKCQEADLLTVLERTDAAVAAIRRLTPNTVDERVRVASLFLSLMQFDEAKKLAEEALLTEPHNLDAGVIAANALAYPAVTRANDERLPPAYLPKSLRADLMRAVELIEKRLPQLRTRDHDDYPRILVNLSAFAAASGNTESALKYSSQAREQFGDNEDVLRNIYVSAVPLEKYEIAAEAAGALAAFIEKDEALRLELEALSAGHHYQRGLDRIAEVRLRSPEVANPPHIRFIEVKLTFERPDIERAEGLLAAVLSEFPEEGHAWITGSEIAAATGDTEREASYLSKAIECNIAPGLKAQCRARLAQIYARRRDWEKALEFFQPEHGEDRDSPFGIEIATCLFNLRRYSEARAAAISILEGGYDSSACDIAIQTAIADHHLDQAMELAKLMREHEHAGKALEHLAHLQVRIGDVEEAERLALRATKQPGSDARSFALLSSIYVLRNKHLEAISSAIKAVGIATDEASKIDANRTLVAAGFSLPPDLKIDEESTKAFRASLAFLDEMKDPSIKAVELGDNFEGLKVMLRAQQDSATEGIEQYKKGLPIYCLSHMAGRDVYDIWRGLRQGGEPTVRVSLGTAEEQQRERAIATSAKGVVLDATAILTLALLGKLSLPGKIYDKVIVPYPTFEQLRRMHDLLTSMRAPTGQVQLVGETLHYDESEAARHEEKEKFLGEIVEFLGTDAVTKSGFTKPRVLNEAIELMETLSESAFAGMCIAKEQDVPLLCDDLGTRQLAAMALDEASFSVQRLLEVARDRGHITKDEYHRCVIVLFQNNYSFISDSQEDVLYHLKTTGWAFDQVARLIFERFDKGDIDRGTASKSMGWLMSHAWGSADWAGRFKGEEWIKYFCERLMSNGNVPQNFKNAALGCLQVIIATPEAAFTLCQHVTSLNWIPKAARELFELVFTSAPPLLAKNTPRLPDEVLERWRSSLQGYQRDKKPL